MYLRAAKTEAEDAGESTEGMASSVSELREELLKLTNGKVDIQLDENTFKSTYQILKELSEVWDSLTDITQANITEMVGGKRNANVVSALLENFSIAEDALETSAGADGSAMAENEKYLDSIQGKIDVMKASFEALSANFMSGDLLKFFVELATGALNLVNGILEIVDALGGLNTVLKTTVGIFAIIKADSIIAIFSELRTSILRLGNDISGVFAIFSDGFKAARASGSNSLKAIGSGFKSVAGLASTAQLAVASFVAVITAISIVKNAIKDSEQAFRDEQQAVLENTSTVLTNANAFKEAYSAYMKYADKTDLTTQQEQELNSAIETITQTMSGKTSALEGLTAGTQAYTDALKEQAQVELENAHTQAKKARDAAEKNLQSTVWSSWDGSQISMDLNGRTGIEEFVEAKSVLEKMMGDYFDETQYGYELEPINFDKNHKDADAIVKYYYDLLAVQDELAKQDLMNNDIYNDSIEITNSLKDAVEQYTKAKYDETAALYESNNGIPASIEEFKKYKDFLTDELSKDFGADTAESLVLSYLKTNSAYADMLSQMQAVENQTDDTITRVKHSTDAVEDSVTKVKELTSEIVAAQELLNSQSTGKSISLDDLNSDELAEYRTALEYVNGTMQLNADKVNDIIKAKSEEQIAINNTNKALAQADYLENAKEIEQYRQKLRDGNFEAGESADSINALIKERLAENDVLATTCAQYDLMTSSIQEATSAYQHWLNAQNASQSGDMFDSALSAFEKMHDTLNNTESDDFGRIGNEDYKAAVDFVVPDSVDKEDQSAVKSYMESINEYFTFDSDKNRTGLDIEQFCKNAVEKGLMVMDESGENFLVAGQTTMEDFAEGLGLSLPLVQAMFGEMEEFGAEFDWSDEAVESFGDLAVKANESAEALRQLKGNEDLLIKLDVSNLATTEEQLAALDGTISEMETVKKASVDASEIEHANNVIQYCITQKQLLTQPDVMRVDTSQVEGDIGNAISLLQQFQEAQNTLEIQSKVGADTTDAQAKIDSLAAEIQALPADIKADLSLDTTSTTKIQESIKGLKASVMVDVAGVNAEAITGYQQETKTCEVIYDPNTDLLPTSFTDLERCVKYVPDTDELPSYFRTLTRYVNYVAIGDHQLNGTAHASGTAKVGGDWGTATGGSTLVGELGREIVVDPRTGKWYTVGDMGAEFVNIPAGAIVFNHLQTESLLKQGFVAGRGMSLVSGTAMVTGGISVSQSKKPSTSQSAKNSSANKKSSSKKTSNSNSDDEPEVFDWIELAIDRIERAIDRLATVATSPFRKLAERINATNDELSQMSYELSLQQSAYDRYMQQAGSVGLSSDLASKVQNGTIDIAEYDGDTADKIKDYQEWYEKALDCKDAILELSESIAELYQNKFDDVAADYENKLSLLEHVTNAYNNGIDDLEERGYLASTKYYEALSDVEKQNIDIQKQELADLTKAMSEGVNSGSIKEGSEAWYEFQQQINEVKESIQESETSLVEFANTIREIKWERFDYLQEQISNITEEADFLIDLMENSDLYTDNGQLTDTGMATMGLHGQNYNVYMAQADKYAAELLELNKEIAEDPNNTKLLERREELLESQRDSILAAEDEKQAIIDMVREGIELELDSLRELIDTYTESLDSAKNLYDYQKKVKQQTAEIASLQKQLSAYSGDTSEETRATMQKLQVDLSDAMESLEETQYDHYISEQKKLLDNLYDEYEMILNERLDNVDALLSDMIDSINTNSASISDTLLTQAEKVGYTISENEKAIWSNEGGANSIITKYGEAFNAQMTTVNDVISKIAIKIGAMATESDKKAETTIKETTPSTKTDTTVKPQTTTNTKKNNTNANSTKFNEDVKRGVAAAIWIYGSKSGWGNDPDRNKRLTAKFGATNAKAVQSYINAHANNGDLYKYWVSTGRSKLSQYYYSAFKKGGLADYTGVAWLDGTPQEPEMVLNPEDTKNFIALKDAMRSVADGDSPLSELFGNGDSSSNILQQLAKIESPMAASGTNIGDITYQITIPIDHVQDYNDFMNQMRKDGKFEKFIKSVTIDRLTGGSKIAKNKYQW